MDKELAALEQMIDRLADCHDQLADLVERQRAAFRRADAGGLAELGGRIEALVGQIARLESARREHCRRLGPRLGLTGERAARARLAEISQRAGGQWGQRLGESAAVLASRLDRLRRLGRVNHAVAARLSEFFGELLGQIARLGRETGCYDARGRRALAEAPIGMSSLSVVG